MSPDSPIEIPPEAILRERFDSRFSHEPQLRARLEDSLAPLAGTECSLERLWEALHDGDDAPLAVIQTYNLLSCALDPLDQVLEAYQALRGLDARSPQEMAALVASALDGSMSDLRASAAVCALGPSAIPFFVKALEAKDLAPDALLRAANLLADLGVFARPAIRALVQQLLWLTPNLSDPDRKLRTQVFAAVLKAGALDLVEREQLVEHATGILRDEDSPPYALKSAFQMLATRKDAAADALPTLVGLIGSTTLDGQERRALWDLLLSLGPALKPHLVQLLQKIREDDEEAHLQLLNAAQLDPVQDSKSFCLAAESGELTAGVIQGLMRLGPEAVEQILLPRLPTVPARIFPERLMTAATALSLLKGRPSASRPGIFRFLHQCGFNLKALKIALSTYCELDPASARTRLQSLARKAGLLDDSEKAYPRLDVGPFTQHVLTLAKRMGLTHVTDKAAAVLRQGWDKRLLQRWELEDALCCLALIVPTEQLHPYLRDVFSRDDASTSLERQALKIIAADSTEPNSQLARVFREQVEKIRDRNTLTPTASQRIALQILAHLEHRS